MSGKGVAGGEKYLVEGIFFKLVRDIHGIYGGDMGASKAAKHEIRSLHELVRCNIEGLFFPMMCLVDHLGIRCVCVSFIKVLYCTPPCVLVHHLLRKQDTVKGATHITKAFFK